MSVSYYVSAKRSTVISRTDIGNFTSPDQLNLVIDRGNRIDIQLVAPEGLKHICDVPIYGRISAMQLFKPGNEIKDSLVVLTEKYHMAVLSYEDGKVITRAAGNLEDRVGRPCSTILTVHKSGIIAARIYEGQLKIISWMNSRDLRQDNIRFDSVSVIDVKFMDSDESLHRLAYIYEDSKGRHLRIVDLIMQENDTARDFKFFAKQDNISNDSAFVIPVTQPAGGVIVLGMDTILYKPDEVGDAVVPVSVPLISRTSFACYTSIDKTGERYLLADDSGRLLMLLLNISNNGNGQRCVTEMRIEYLGEISIPDSINYLDNGVLFVGSRLGDSQLARLTISPNPDGSFIEVLETFTNIGPIRDMVHVDCDGQPQLITCSGDKKEGSLRIIRNGIGIEESASVDLAGVSGLFSMRLNSELDNYIAVSLKDETHILSIDGEELEDVGLLEVDTEMSSLYVGVLFNSDVVLQVTSKEVRLMADGVTTDIWKPDTKDPVAKVAVNAKYGQVVVSARNCLYYLKCTKEEEKGLKITQVSKREYPVEISCVDISNKTDSPEEPATLAACAFWIDYSAEVVKLPGLETVLHESLPSTMIARSIIITSVDNINYMLVALGDGCLFYYTYDIDTGAISEVKTTSVGTRPPSVHRVWSKKRQHLFVCSDRPVIIFSLNKKLVFSNVNVKLVHAVCSLQSSSYQDCLVLSDGKSMVFGSVDDIQKIHVRTIPMGEAVRRVVHQKSSGTYAVISARDDSHITSEKSLCASKTALNTSRSTIKAQRSSGSEGSVGVVSNIMILDQHTFQVLHAHEFSSNEMAVSIISDKLGDDPKNYYIIGTAYILPEEKEARMGRIIVFEVESDRTKLRKVHEKDIRGSPYSLTILNGKLLVGVNSSVRLFEWSADHELRLECSNFNHVTAISVKTMGDQIMVADLMRSVSILTYRSMEGTIDEIAKDWESKWCGSSEFITAEKIIASEFYGNLFTTEVNKPRLATDDGRYVLDSTGCFYLGDMVNVMRRCTLINSPNDSAIQTSHPIMFGTIDGCIGMVVQIDESWRKFLMAIETAVADSTENCLQIDHTTYRQFLTERQSKAATGFIDGDLIESILELDRAAAMAVLSKMNFDGIDTELPRDPAEILKMIEDLSRIH